MERKATAYWLGNLSSGKGMLTTESAALSKVPYTFKQRFGNAPGTNPEELIGAAHAGCFAMALAGELAKEQLTADSIDVEASVRLEKEDSWAITHVHLNVQASVPGASVQQFHQAVDAAKTGCPVSKLLNTDISVETRLQPGLVNPLQETG
jgi:osmotically inducible protein OsmC